MGLKAQELHNELLRLTDSKKTAFFPRFFKTGAGQYGEGNRFIGVTVPNIRKVAKVGRDLPLDEVQKLISSKWHEDRLLAVIILVGRFERGDDLAKHTVYEFYMKNVSHINNWDIVDSSARQIAGAYLYFGRQGTKLTILARSASMWERRIAMIATSYWLTKNDPKPTIEIAEILINDNEDLMHKAVGWMLREMGKRCGPEILREFLTKHAATMPRTALRYAIEHFDVDERAKWLAMRRQASVS